MVAKLLARVRRVAADMAVHMVECRAAEPDIPAMQRIESPVGVGEMLSVKAVVSRKIDIDAVMMPIEEAPQSESDGNSCAPVPGNTARRRPIRRVVRRYRPPPRSVGHVRIVSRHIDHLRIAWRDRDVTVTDRHELLGVTHECACIPRAASQILDFTHDLGLLTYESLAEVSSPRQVPAHAIEDRTERA
jgi:hypothetical protein